MQEQMVNCEQWDGHTSEWSEEKNRNESQCKKKEGSISAVPWRLDMEEICEFKDKSVPQLKRDSNEKNLITYNI